MFIVQDELGQKFRVSFEREGDKKVTCEIRQVYEGQPFSTWPLLHRGEAKRNDIDKFDKGIGFMVALSRAMRSYAYGCQPLSRKERKLFVRKFYEWAIINNVRTSLIKCY
jgi:hypothetical protein